MKFFLEEYNDLKKSLNSTIENNPVLSKEREYFIFSSINISKNRIFSNILKEDAIFELFLNIVDDYIAKNDQHSVFMLKSFNNSREYDSNLNESIDFVNHLRSTDKNEVLEKIKNFNINYDIFSECLEHYKSVKNNELSTIIKILIRELDYYYDKMYLANFKLIIKFISYYKNTESFSPVDLFSEGIIGLHRAIQLFNCDLDIKFSTYASQWIKSTIDRTLADKDSLIRIPVNMRNYAKQFEKLKEELSKDRDEPVSDEEVLSKMKKKPSSTKNININFSYYPIYSNSSDESFNGDNDVTFEENLIDHKIIDEADVNTIKRISKVFKDYINGLKNKDEVYYIKNYFGINDEGVIKSREEIMQELQINANEYEQIRKRTIKNIKKKFYHNKIARDANQIQVGWESHSNTTGIK